MARDILTDEEYDNMAVQSQLDYLYCPACEMFYNRETNRVCPCGGIQHD